jgi:tetratricopeptide (TPR) repeat protein
MFKLLCSIIVTLALAATAAAAPGARFALSVQQVDSATNAGVRLYDDTCEFVQGLEATGFLVAFSLDLKLTNTDTAGASFTVHVNTHAEQPHNYSQRYQVEYGLPARMEGIIGKPGTNYTLTMTPLERTDIDTSACRWVHYVPDNFRVDPTAYFDLYYVERSLADFYWNVARGLLDTEYRNFAKLNNFSMPGKYHIFLCPCRLWSVIWDDRFGMMVDPTRLTAFGIYSRDLNSVDPFLINYLAVLRNYGYAPAFLAEGYASYPISAVYNTRRILKRVGPVSLDSLLDTHTYFASDPEVADCVAATFVRYLVDQYTLDKFLALYKQADDLNLRSKLQTVYGKSVADLTAEWRRYVDTVAVTFQDMSQLLNIAEAMREYGVAVRYAQEKLRLAATRNDSTVALNDLVRTSYFSGDYYTALDMQTVAAKLDSAKAASWIGLASYQMMNGEYDIAAATLERARSLDSGNQAVAFNIGLNALIRGDTSRAREKFSAIVERPVSNAALNETRCLLGHLLLRSGQPSDRQQAFTYFSKVTNELAGQTGQHDPSSYRLLWLGIAYFGAGDTGNAWDVLQVAWFLENRPFYTGMINLWLGKIADVRGERDVARDFYGQVLSGASAQYHQEEARRYLESPYTQ